MTGLTEINLRRHYPNSIRLAFMRSFHWIVAFIILVVILMAVDTIVPTRSVGVTNDVFIVLGTLVFGLAIILVAGKLIYETLYFIMFSYRVENQQLLVSKGVVWRSNATFPLFRLTDVYVERNPLELLFFISTLQITTAASTADGATVGGIEGLPYSTAIALQNFITELAASVQPEVSDAKKEQVLREHLPPDSPGARDGLTARITGAVDEAPAHQVEANGIHPSPLAKPGISEAQLQETLDTLDTAEQDIKRLKIEVEQLKEAQHEGDAQQNESGNSPTTRIPKYADPT